MADHDWRPYVEALRRLADRVRTTHQWAVLVHRYWRMRNLAWYTESMMSTLREAYAGLASLDVELSVLDRDQIPEGVIEQRVADARERLAMGIARADRTRTECLHFYMETLTFCPGCGEANNLTTPLQFRRTPYTAEELRTRSTQ